MEMRVVTIVFVQYFSEFKVTCVFHVDGIESHDCLLSNLNHCYIMVTFVSCSSELCFGWIL
jgi:hypothetical protein